jgi:hypothetical protein
VLFVKKIAVISCSNGLGHIKRQIVIVSNLLEQNDSIKIDFYCESWQLSIISDWDTLNNLKNNKSVHFKYKNLPLKWSDKESYYSEWLLNWHKSLASWNLQTYDLVITDNLIEPLYYTKSLLLIGSFLWHDVLNNAFPKSKYVKQYYQNSTNLLLNNPTWMLSNEWFVMPEVLKQTKCVKIGFVPFDERSEIIGKKKEKKNGLQLLIALGNAINLTENKIVIDLFINYLQFRMDIPHTIMCNNDSYTYLKEFTNKAVLIDDFSQNTFTESDIVFVRGGIGTITDCLYHKKPIFYINDSNYEISYNQYILSKLKAGFSLDYFIEKDMLVNNISNDLFSNEIYSNFRMSGAREAVEFMTHNLI